MDIGRLIATEERSSVERWCKQQAQQAYVGDNKVLCRILGKLYCYVDGRDTALAPYLMLDGFWEMWVTQAVCRYVKPKMTCIDVGASFGYYTLLMADLVGERGKVVSFEPDLDSAALLAQSVAVNGFGGLVDYNQVAIGATETSAGLMKPDWRWSDAQLVPGTAAYPEVSAYPSVEVRPLDALLPSAAKIDFIKIDAEGSEFAIWQGMQGVLNRDDPIILMEFASHLGEPEKLLAAIQAAGYPLRHVAHSGEPEPITREQLMIGGVDMLWLDRR